MGASPWTASPQLAFSPKGTTGASIHSAPLGRWGYERGGDPVFMGSRPTVGSRPMVYNMPSRWDFRRFPIDQNAPRTREPRTRIATFSILTWRLPIFYLLPKS